jgi:hypothetical protein
LAELERKGQNHIRHELFSKIIFPVLYDGYKNKDVQSMIWIIKFNHIFRNHKIEWDKIDKKNDTAILKECYGIDPNNNEIIKMYIKYMIEKINREHVGSINWTIESLEHTLRNSINEINYKSFLEDIQLLNKLEDNPKYNEWAVKWENKIKEYKKILQEIGKIEKI